MKSGRISYYWRDRLIKTTNNLAQSEQNFMDRIRFFVFILSLGLSNVVLADDPLQIFILHSYSQEYPWTKFQHEGFTSRYYTGTRQAAIISSE